PDDAGKQQDKDRKRPARSRHPKRPYRNSGKTTGQCEPQVGRWEVRIINDQDAPRDDQGLANNPYCLGQPAECASHKAAAYGPFTFFFSKILHALSNRLSEIVPPKKLKLAIEICV